jgi:DNA-binding Lrp family transcriptional regulator
MRIGRKDRRLLTRLQHGFPLVKRPFERLGKDLGITEQECMGRTQALLDRGYLRYIKPVVDARASGFASVLVALKVRPRHVDRVAQAVSGKQEVTHNYLRASELNLWFTYTYESDAKKRRFFRDLRHMKGVVELFEFPTEKTYKIGLVLAV